MAPVVPTQSAAAPEPIEPKKNSNTLLVAGILGGACLLVAVIGVGVVVWKLSQAAKSAEGQIAGALEGDMATAVEQLAAELESNPPGGLKPEGLAPIADEMQKALAGVPGAAPGVVPVSAQRSASPASTAAAAKLIGSLQSWTDVSQLRAIALNNIKLQVESVWLATDEAGTRIEPAVTTSGSTATGTAPAKYVFVELQLLNTAPVPRKYTSWNATGGTTAVLADQAGTPLVFVPPATTPAVNRLNTADIPAGQTISDVLVFSAPQGPIEKLKLAVAKSALAGNAKTRGTHFALEIPLEVLLRKQAGTAVAAGAAAAPVLARQAPAAGESPGNPAIIAAPETGVPAAGDKPAEPAKGPKRPPTREELNRQFEELSKKEAAQKELEAKAGDANQ
jgi:hypothetical protein